MKSTEQIEVTKTRITTDDSVLMSLLFTMPCHKNGGDTSWLRSFPLSLASTRRNRCRHGFPFGAGVTRMTATSRLRRVPSDSDGRGRPDGADVRTSTGPSSPSSGATARSSTPSGPDGCVPRRSRDRRVTDGGLEGRPGAEEEAPAYSGGTGNWQVFWLMVWNWVHVYLKLGGSWSGWGGGKGSKSVQLLFPIGQRYCPMV